MPANRLFSLILFGLAGAAAACSPTNGDMRDRTPLRFDQTADGQTKSGSPRHGDDPPSDTSTNAAPSADSQGDSETPTPNEPPSDDATDSESDSIHESDRCSQFCEFGKFRIEDPTRVISYDARHLGLVALCGESARHAPCVDRALRDGAILVADENGASPKKILLYPTRFEAFIDDSSERVDTTATEGRWSETLDRVVPGVDGRRVSPEKTFENFRQAITSGAASFALAIESIPALSSNLNAIGDFKPTVKIGSFQTKFTRSRNRTHNVKLAADAVDGLFLMPGAEFSYNDWVGERSEERGFREAPVIEQGQLVEGIGGGACQVSSTIHAAALLSGLEIVERYNHSLPSSYISMGMDAVVSYPALDLRIKNNFDRPVVLRVSIEDNVLMADFYSDVPRASKVYFRHEVAEEIPYKEVVTVDPSLPPATTKITKRGKPGYRVLRSRLVFKDGKESFEKFYDDIYQPQTQNVTISPDVVYPPPDQPRVEPAATR